MNPSVELRLRTMIRALTEVILPAVDPTNSLAQEQARLLLGHLYALLGQHAHASEFSARASQALEAFARSLVENANGGAATLAAARELQHALTNDVAAIGHRIEDLLVAAATDGDPTWVRTARQLTLDYSTVQAMQGRAWFKAMGFDATPAALPDIPSLLTTLRADRV